MQKTMKPCNPLAQAVGMRPFFNKFSLYLMFNCTRNVSEVLTRNGDGFVATFQAGDLAEPSYLVSEKK